MEEPMREVHLYFEHLEVSAPEEATLEEARQLHRMQEETHHEEQNVAEGEVPAGDDEGKASTLEDDTAEDNTYKLGLEAMEFNAKDDYVDFLVATEYGLEDFDEEGGEGGEGEIGGGEVGTQFGKRVKECTVK
ncbi:hypothetical protein CDL15_Pgr013836 [Punica granatum]|uniref:Uncharacterized protein n=1 Tax=Punica granatum TaxID=22663 RepID=A0A218VWS9_PUNGR|nr:hypothetical protein CDL15_Pgr013836 [Punica granatum]